MCRLIFENFSHFGPLNCIAVHKQLKTYYLQTLCQSRRRQESFPDSGGIELIVDFLEMPEFMIILVGYCGKELQLNYLNV